jgi:hypothetical protein
VASLSSSSTLYGLIEVGGSSTRSSILEGIVAVVLVVLVVRPRGRLASLDDVKGASEAATVNVGCDAVCCGKTSCFDCDS